MQPPCSICVNTELISGFTFFSSISMLIPVKESRNKKEMNGYRSSHITNILDRLRTYNKTVLFIEVPC